jgi:proteasome component ECM29
MEILVHINKRIKSRPNVQLPLDDLLEKFNDPQLSSLSFFAVIKKKNFSPLALVIRQVKQNKKYLNLEF